MARQRRGGYREEELNEIRTRVRSALDTPPAIETEADWFSCTDPYRMFVHLCPQWGRVNGDRAGDWVTDRRLWLYVEAVGCDQCQELTRGERAEVAVAHVIKADCRTREEKANLLREVFGNPWHRTGACGRVWLNCSGQPMAHQGCRDCATRLSWNDGIVPRIAQQMYDSRDSSRSWMLADALEEAGADPDSEIVRHFRGQVRCPHDKDWPARVPIGGCEAKYGYLTHKPCDGTGWVPKPVPCVRGCSFIDLLLGKE